MAKRRVQSDVMQNLSGLADMATLLQGQEMEGDVDLTGTAQEMQPPEVVQFPQVPRNPEMFEDEVGVDDVPGIPEGIELLGDLAGMESREDALDDMGDQKTPVSLPETSEGTLQDPLEFIRMRIQEEPELAQYLPEETRQLLASSQAAPEKSFVAPPREEEVIETQEEMPQPEQEGGVMQAISDYFSPTKRSEAMEERNQKYLEDQAPQLPPAVESLPDQGTGQDVQPEDIPQEGLGAVPGAVEAAQTNPALIRNVENILGLKRGGMPEEVMEHAKFMQNSLTQQYENLSETERKYKEKIERGDLSTFDKVALGIAIAIPVIGGLVYGKGAFLASLGGAAKGFGEALQKRDESDLKMLGKIGEIQKEKRGISEKKSKLKEEYLKNIDNPAVRKLFNNYDIINIKEGVNRDPEISVGKDAMVIGDTIGLSGGDESGVLWYDTNQIRDDDDVKNFKSAVKDAKVAISEMKEVNSNIDDFMDTMEAIRKQGPNAYNQLVQYIQPSENNWLSFAGGVVPDKLKALTVDMVGNDGKVRNVKALPLLGQKVAALQDAYKRRYLEQNQLTKHFTQHWQSIFPDPTSIESWIKSDYKTMVQQAQNFKNLLNKKTVETLAGAGFLREPIEKLFPVSGSDILRSPSIDMADIEANPEKYRSKVKK